jgi:hypothetical protein
VSSTYWRVASGRVVGCPVGTLVEVSEDATAWRIGKPGVGVMQTLCKATTTERHDGDDLVLSDSDEHIEVRLSPEPNPPGLGDLTATIAAPIDVAAVTGTSRRGCLLGLALALGIPVSYLLLAFLVQNGIAPYDPVHALLGPLSTIALIGLLLAPIGVGIAGWSAGVRSPVLLAVLVVAAVPVLAFVWFMCAATLSGALGNPF